MGNKIQALLIEAAQKLGTSVTYNKSTLVGSDGIIEISYFIAYIGGDNFEFTPIHEQFKHSMEVVIYLESLINNK